MDPWMRQVLRLKNCDYILQMTSMQVQYLWLRRSWRINVIGVSEHDIVSYRRMQYTQ